MCQPWLRGIIFPYRGVWFYSMVGNDFGWLWVSEVELRAVQEAFQQGRRACRAAELDALSGVYQLDGQDMVQVVHDAS